VRSSPAWLRDGLVTTPEANKSLSNSTPNTIPCPGVNPGSTRTKPCRAASMPILQARGVPDVFRFVNARCGFLSALTPLQPRYAKKIVDEDSLMAVLVAQAMNHGMLSMAETSDIPYDVLQETHQQHLRLAKLRAANDKISNFIAGLDIFPLYSFNTEILYGGVDGQKFESATPTIKARYSRKHFGRGKGVVAYTRSPTTCRLKRN